MGDVAESRRIVDRFVGPYAFLSNFAPARVVLDGVDYPTVEAAYQAAKSDDPNHRSLCRMTTPGNAKRLGRRCALRPDWEDAKVPLMRFLLLQKFAWNQTPDYCAALLATGDALLIEGNTWGDRYWGQSPVGRGENMLGKLLMEVRLQRRAEHLDRGWA